MSESSQPETAVHPQVASGEVTLLNKCARLRVPDGKEFGCRSCPLFQYAKCFTKQDEAQYQASLDKLNPSYLEKAIAETENRVEVLKTQQALGADNAGVVGDAEDELAKLRESLEASEEEWPKKQNNLYMAESLGPMDADVLVVFEAPSGPEDRAKKSFEGGAAKLVRKRLREAGLNPDRMRFTYLARCRPPKEVDWKVASRCQRFLADEVRKVQPKIIVAFGAIATGVLVGKDDVSIQHYATVAQRAVVCGRPVDVFPMLSPGFILRNDWMAPKYVQHFEALAKFIRGETAVLEDKSTYEIVTDPDRAIEVCLELLEQVKLGKVLDCDIETSGLSPYKQGMRFSTMSLCAHVSKGYAIMFDHDECPWSDEDRQRVITDGLKPLLTHEEAKLRWHNGKFDVRWIKHMLGFWPRDQFEDTMLAHYAMDENVLHGLKALALMYTDMGDYDEELDRYLATQDVPDRPRYDLVPLNLLGKYAAFDTLATRKLSRALRKEAERQDVHIRSLAYRVMPAISAACARLEHTGMCIDLDYARTIALPHLKREEEKSLAAVMKDPIVRQFIRDKEAAKRAKMKKPKPIELKRYFEFSLDSPKQMQELLYGERYYHHEVTVLSESGAPSTDKEAMTELIKAGSPIAKALQEYRLDQKLRATYCEPVVQRCEEQGDNILHVSILAHGTVTGRASCVHEDTRVVTENGMRRIVEIDTQSDPNTRVLTHNGHWARVLRRVYKGQAAMYAVTLEDGRRIVCTAQHAVYTPEGWRTVAELACGCRIYATAHDAPEAYRGLLDCAGRAVVPAPVRGAGAVEGGSGPPVQCQQQDVGGILCALGAEVRGGAPESAEGTEVPVDAGQLPRFWSAVGGAGSGAAPRDGGGGDVGARHGQGPGLQRVPGAPESHPSSGGGDVGRTQGDDLRAAGRIQAAGEAAPRDAGRVGRVHDKSSGVLGHPVCGVPAAVGPAMAREGSRGQGVALESRDRAGREVACVLEGEPRGADAGPGAHGCWNPASAGGGGSRGRAYRLLLSDSAVVRGSGWVSSCPPEVPGRGAQAGAADPETGLDADAVHGRGRGEGYRAGGFDYRAVPVASIVPVGVHDVWDIIVEGDQSYVAQGFVNHNTRDPNLQSTPNKGASVIKRMFVSRFGDDGCVVQFDYSQIELRILAAVSGDPKMIAAYENGEDLHTVAACMIFSTTVEQHKALPKDEQKRRRTVAKRINFGIAYGIGAPGIQHSLQSDGVQVTVEEAKKFLDTFYSKFPRVGKWIEKIEASTEDDFFSRSLFGRRRRLEQVRSFDKDTKSRAKRQAVNHVIQSTAADFTWTSLILMDQEIALRSGRKPSMIMPTIEPRVFPVDKRWKDVSLVLQVHDSILCDCPLAMAGEVVDMFYRTMPKVVDLAPLVWGPEISELLKPMRRVKPDVDGEVGTSWRDAYKVKTGADVPLAMHVARTKRAKLDADVTYKWGDDDDKAAVASFKGA
ncbi:MAG: DNA polymerase I, thermostable [Firmicutes bacterium ADurb.Bin506]|nr:MAG: DNA polymerase I, thermostable [Firmicutes bacterium ADurb.Bin506]